MLGRFKRHNTEETQLCLPAKKRLQRQQNNGRGSCFLFVPNNFCQEHAHTHTHREREKNKRGKKKKDTLRKQKMNLLIRDKLLALHFGGKQRFLDAFYLCSSDISCWNMCWVRGKQSMAGITRMLRCCFGFSKWKVLFVLEFVLKWFFFLPGTTRTLLLLYSHPCFPANTHPFPPR